ncbi:MAG: uncharacterized protein A8A55_3421 [Amphiamblys sp. WSBS2006]|nr:MAG: uncharacterized protein A8A55_3421 [Amphiamblys sp. WSBS2006]
MKFLCSTTLFVLLFRDMLGAKERESVGVLEEREREGAEWPGGECEESTADERIKEEEIIREACFKMLEILKRNDGVRTYSEEIEETLVALFKLFLVFVFEGVALAGLVYFGDR